MSVDTGELTAPPAEATRKTEIPLKEKATAKANELIDKKIDSIALKHVKPDGDKEKIDLSSMDKDELNLFSVGLLRDGFTDEEYKDGGIELTDGLAIKTTDGQEVTISSLLDDDDKTGKRIYKAKTEIEDTDNPGTTKTTEVFVEAEEVVRAHMANTADSIATNFTNQGEIDLVKWGVSGKKGELTNAAKELLEANPLAEADLLINDSITSTQLEVNNLKKKEGKLTKTEQDLITQKEQLLLQLRVALQRNGEGGFAELGRLDALLLLGKNGVEVSYEALHELLGPQAEKARKILHDKLINETDAADEDLELLEKQGLNAIINDGKLTALGEKFLKVQGIDKLIFGREMSNDEIITMLGQNLTDQQREWLKNTGKLGGGLLIAILLGLAAIPVAAVGSAVYVGANAGNRR